MIRSNGVVVYVFIIAVVMVCIANIDYSEHNPLMQDQAQAYLKCEPLAPEVAQADFKREPLATEFPQMHFQYTFA
jgi:hypothetical protein